MAEFLFLVIFYGVPFMALFMLRRPRWLAAGVALAILVVAGLFAAVQNSSGDSGLAAFFVLAAALVGFLSGLGARLSLFAMGRAGDGKPLPEKLVGLLFFFGIPLVIYVASYVAQEQSRRRYAPPSDACRSRLHEVKLGDSVLHLPLVPSIHLSEGRSIEKSTMLSTPEKAREFCERTAWKAPRLTAVRIFFSPYETPQHLRAQPPCDHPRPQAWWPALCRFKPARRMEIHGIGLFHIGKYDSRTMLSFELDSGEGSGIPAGRTWTNHPDGFARAQRDGTTFLRAATRAGATSPWIGRCVQQKSTISDEIIWRCWAGYRLTPSVGLTYNFEAGIDTFAEDARRIDGQAFAIARSLMRDDGTVPVSR